MILEHGQLEVTFWLLTTHTHLKWNFTEWTLHECFYPRERDGEQSLLAPCEPNLLCFVFCLWDHLNVFDSSFYWGVSKRLTVAAWPPHRAGMWDTSGFICSQTLRPEAVTNIRALLCLKKHPEHWNQAWRNKLYLKAKIPPNVQILLLIHCLTSEWG